MKIKFKKLNPEAVLPTHAHPGDAGADITAVSNGEWVQSPVGKDLFYYIQYKTGLACKVPDGYVGLLFPRSSQSKTGLALANAVGVLDSSYSGEIMLRFRIDTGMVEQANTDKADVAIYKKGDRIAQLVVVPYVQIEAEEVDSLEETERGAGGFGSSGN